MKLDLKIKFWPPTTHTHTQTHTHRTLNIKQISCSSFLPPFIWGDRLGVLEVEGLCTYFGWNFCIFHLLTFLELKNLQRVINSPPTNNPNRNRLKFAILCVSLQVDAKLIFSNKLAILLTFFFNHENQICI